MGTKFQRKIENFKCLNCREEVLGDGYTNHCHKCLWSRHVDDLPGDRNSECGGLMEPIGIVKNGMEFSIIHKCQKCGLEKKNKASKKDDFQEILKVVTRH